MEWALYESMVNDSEWPPSSVAGALVHRIEDKFHEEEEDILYVLFFIRKNHGKFAAKRVKKFEQEIVPSREGELNFWIVPGSSVISSCNLIIFLRKRAQV